MLIVIKDDNQDGCTKHNTEYETTTDEDGWNYRRPGDKVSFNSKCQYNTFIMF